MDIQLFNTLGKKKEVFKPLSAGKVGMYHCGPTVYDRVHVGNLRAYVFADILRRTFEYNDYKVAQVINITDVGHLVSDADDGDDKMTKALVRLGKSLSLESMDEVATLYYKMFLADLVVLNVKMPSELPRASTHIAEDVEMIKILEAKGFAYKTSDGVYFETSKLADYGKLIGSKKNKTDEGESRIGINPEKHDPADFALWKFNPKLGWDSPWGKGFPGWHIECSAMSRKYLGQPFDIHTGGIDHIPTHHTNEIAQSEAAYGESLANYWMHGAFLTLNNAKMAKSAGGFITLQSLIDEGVSPLTFRYWLLTAHYRSPVNFTLEALHAAQNALIRFMASVASMPDGGKVNAEYQQKFLAFVNDDLDMPRAVALAWDLMKDETVTGADKRATLLDFDRVFGLGLATAPRVKDEPVPVEIQALVDAREEARKAKDWKKSDAIRAEINERGYDVKDTSKGPEIIAQ